MKMDGLLRIDGRILADLLAQVNGRSIGLGQPRPTFAPLRWLQNWKRRRWLARTSRALFRVMHYEVQRDIDAMLLCFCDHGGALLRSLRADLPHLPGQTGDRGASMAVGSAKWLHAIGADRRGWGTFRGHRALSGEHVRPSHGATERDTR